MTKFISLSKGRAKQLYNAGYKKIEDIARAKPKDLVSNIEHMNNRLAHQLVSAAKVIEICYEINIEINARSILLILTGYVAGKVGKFARRSSRMYG